MTFHRNRYRGWIVTEGIWILKFPNSLLIFMRSNPAVLQLKNQLISHVDIVLLNNVHLLAFIFMSEVLLPVDEQRMLSILISRLTILFLWRYLIPSATYLKMTFAYNSLYSALLFPLNNFIIIGTIGKMMYLLICKNSWWIHPVLSSDHTPTYLHPSSWVIQDHNIPWSYTSSHLYHHLLPLNLFSIRIQIFKANKYLVEFANIRMV